MSRKQEDRFLCQRQETGQEGALSRQKRPVRCKSELCKRPTQMVNYSRLLRNIPRCPGTCLLPGYREKSHYCLAVALRALFVDEGKIDAQLVRDFLNAMNLREAADYEAEFSRSGAEAVIASAERFIQKAATILDIGE